MYPAVADAPEGPFRLARGKDEFRKPYSPASTLLQTENPGGIDAEVFVDDDGQAYVFWGRRHVAKLDKDMVTVDSVVHTIVTPRKEYSEGSIFFKRKGIYYYLYTIGGDERYQYAYVMSRVSPMGPFEYPEQDIVSMTNRDRGVFGPGHGSVFHPENTDDYYFAFLEFGRRSTNRQTYVNRLLFNEDGTIRPVEVTLDGVGALKKSKRGQEISVSRAYASSVADSLFIEPNQDPLCRRTEYFVADFACDGSNGSRWMASETDDACWLAVDLGSRRRVGRSELYFVQPTAGHAYLLEGSVDGRVWETCGGHADRKMQSPHVDQWKKKYRYLRVKIQEGTRGVWEWKLYK